MPDHAAKLVKLGAQVMVERGAGAAAGFDDAAYTAAGAVVESRSAAFIADGVIVPAGTFNLTWPAVPGITYTVQFSPTMTGAWQDLGTATPTTAAGAYTATPPAPAPAIGFFRLILK